MVGVSRPRWFVSIAAPNWCQDLPGGAHRPGHSVFPQMFSAGDPLLGAGAIAPNDGDPLAGSLLGPLERRHGEGLERDALVGGERRRAGAGIGRDHDARRAWEEEEERRGGDRQRTRPHHEPTAPSDARGSSLPVTPDDLPSLVPHGQRLRSSADPTGACNGLVTSRCCDVRPFGSRQQGIRTPSSSVSQEPRRICKRELRLPCGSQMEEAEDVRFGAHRSPSG